MAIIFYLHHQSISIRRERIIKKTPKRKRKTPKKLNIHWIQNVNNFFTWLIQWLTCYGYYTTHHCCRIYMYVYKRCRKRVAFFSTLILFYRVHIHKHTPEVFNHLQLRLLFHKTYFFYNLIKSMLIFTWLSRFTVLFHIYTFYWCA